MHLSILLNPRWSSYLLVAIFATSLIYTYSSCSKKVSSAKNASLPVPLEVRKDFHQWFQDCGVTGSLLLHHLESGKWISSDSTSIHTYSLPASTFKIPNLLIALNTKTIENTDQVIPWVGATDTSRYGYRPEIYHDMKVKEAFQTSAGWVFVEFSKRIGHKHYRQTLKELNYGNQNISDKDADFWNFGKFGVTPYQQIQLLKGLYLNQLPFDPQHMEQTRQTMLAEYTDQYKIHAKTGWTREGGINTGWWVGYASTPSGTWFFATRLFQDRKNNRDDFGPCRKEITRKALRAVKAMP